MDRIKEIRSHKVKLGYVSSEDNPADIASRGETVENLQNNKKWWEGPEWLSLSRNEWPSPCYEISDETRAVVIHEERKNKLFETGLVSATATEVDVNSPFKIDEGKYSSHIKLIRITSWCVRFINALKKRTVNTNFLTSQELIHSSLLWTRYIQKKHFSDVLTSIDKSTNNILKNRLGLYRDSEGVLRCGGRFMLMEVHPKLLPKSKDSHYTKLIIERAHKRVHHAGVSQTLANARQE